MIDIAKRKLPSAVMGVLIYLSYCAASWYVMRGNMAYYGEHYGWAAWFANDVWAFFIGGIIPFLFYLFLSRYGTHMLISRIGRRGVENVRYGLNYAIIAANIVLFGLKFIFLAAPMYATLLNIILDPAVTFLCVGLYLLYAFGQRYVDKSMYGDVVVVVSGIFITAYGVIAVVNLLLTVM